jgi:hypothetical protein
VQDDAALATIRRLELRDAERLHVGKSRVPAQRRLQRSEAICSRKDYRDAETLQSKCNLGCRGPSGTVRVLERVLGTEVAGLRGQHRLVALDKERRLHNQCTSDALNPIP